MMVYMELIKDFYNYEEFHSFIKDNLDLINNDIIKEYIKTILKNGIYDPLTDEYIPPSEILISGENYRETIYARGLISRTRAVLLAMRRCLNNSIHQNLKIYSPEAITPFALYMRGKFPFFLGSEYGVDPEEFFPIPVEDLLSLTFKDDSFDVIIVNDVFEHIPDLKRALTEIKRCLKIKGYLIATFPFAFNERETIIKAKMNSLGEIEYLCEPEYHGNPVKPKEGSLVFQIPAWDILNLLNEIGFNTAKMVFILSVKYGIISPFISGCFVCVAQK